LTLLLKQLFGLIRLLNSDTGHNQIAAGVAAGLILGFSPLISLQGICVLIFLFVFRIQIGMAFISAFFFAFIAWIFDPLFHGVGVALLESGQLAGLWTWLYNLPIVPYTRFNNSVVLGAGVAGFLLAPLVFFISRIMVIRYRITVVEKFKETKAWKAFKTTAFYQWYYTYDKLYGH
jgi:uncharacterized protein (TIGR03546 family)